MEVDSSATTSDAPSPVPVPFTRRTILADSLVAAAVIGGFYALVWVVPFPPFGVPGYLLLVAFDALEAVLPPFASSAAYDAAFAGFLATLAVTAGVAASWTRSRGATHRWKPAAGVAAAVVGVVGLLVALGIFLVNAGTDYGPFLLVTGTALALLVGGRYVVVGRFGRGPV